MRFAFGTLSPGPLKSSFVFEAFFWKNAVILMDFMVVFEDSLGFFAVPATQGLRF